MSSSLTFEVTGNTGAFVFPEFASLPFFTLLDGFMVELGSSQKTGKIAR